MILSGVDRVVNHKMRLEKKRLSETAGSAPLKPKNGLTGPPASVGRSEIVKLEECYWVRPASAAAHMLNKPWPAPTTYVWKTLFPEKKVGCRVLHTTMLVLFAASPGRFLEERKENSMRNERFWKVASICLLSVVAGVALGISSPAYGQISGAAKGQPVIATSATTATSDGSYFDVLVGEPASVGDMCQRIVAAWNGLPTNSGTIDARGFTGAQACSVNPFVTGVYGKLLLGNVVISATVGWQIPARVHVEGLATSGTTAATTANTTIQASSGFNGGTYGALVQLGDGGSQTFDVGLKGVTVDCYGISGCNTGILNNSSEEGSTVEDVNVFNAPCIGVHVAIPTTGSYLAANSGPYRNINIQYTSHFSSGNCLSTVGLEVTGPNSGHVVRGFDNFTISAFVSAGNYVSTAAQGVLIYGASALLTNSHVEYFPTGIQIGNSSNTNNVQVENVSITGVSSGPDVLIDSGSGDVLLSGINDTSTSAAADILQDTVTGNTLTTSANKFLGWYFLGQGTNPAVFTSSSSVGWQAPQNLKIIGNLSKGGGSFKIDSPLDPANKYLYHSFVESPDMMNIYNGSVTTDKHGMATVTLPEYFDALNKDFRYQLTAIGSFAQATVAKEIQDNQFAIRTNKPGVKVSWQVTGIRHDAYANAHRVQVEEQKPPREQGHYLHPELLDSGVKETVAKQDPSK
jgi:hypothetical protein